MAKFNIPLRDAIEIVLNEAAASKTEKLHISDSLGRVTAADLTAPVNVPHFDRSPFDGYAFMAADTSGASRDKPVKLHIIEEIRAGDSPQNALRPGEAAKILTGAPIPAGADAVTKYEETEFTAEAVTIFEEFAAGDNIVPAGEDIKAGSLAVKAGYVIDPPLVGLLASLGVTHIEVVKRPRVALCNFGSELIEIHKPLMPGKIYNSNLYTFASYLKAEGLAPLELGVVPDDIESMAEIIKRGAELSDVLITTGGVSVGDYDLVRGTMESIGAEILFWKMDIKPGSSILVSKLGGKLILSLSGNPAAAAVGFKLLGVPYLRKLMGHKNPVPSLFKLKLLEPVKKESPRTRILPGALRIRGGMACFTQHGIKGNGVLSSLIGCDILGVIPAGSPPLEAGAYIEAFMYEDDNI